MQVKISKTLEGIIARTAFHTTKAAICHHLKDHLMLELLREEGALAYQLLSARLQAWELYQLRLRIEHAVRQTDTAPSHQPDPFFRRYTNELLARFQAARSLSTGHLLLDILRDATSCSAPLFARYRITHEEIAAALDEAADAPAPTPRIEVRMLDESLLSPTEQPPVTTPLDRFGTDLTAEARRGGFDPLIGREQELDRLVQVLSRRKKNNPMLIGEAGVGKTALVEGLAQRIAEGRVPHALRHKRLFALDIAALVAGTKFRGEFEERLQQLLQELRRTNDTILFIDEIHTIVGAGATQGALDTANILKPVLARGELQTIGATTFDEYRTHIETDSALERRFCPIRVEAATPTEARSILHRLAPRYAQHHGVHYSEEALDACVELAERYLTDRHLPDKAIDLMDEAGARHAARKEQQSTLGRSVVEQTITHLTGIPIERIAGSEQQRLQRLGQHLASRIVGQTEAVERLTRAIQRARTGLKAANRPIGVFLFVGPTGVGKTLLAKELSKWLFDEQRGLIRLDMSEYGEKHNIARLIGSPPGYVGYGEGGQLTEAVRRRPYAVVLFDEIEKAHPDLFNTLLQLFDEGHLTDGAGRRVDFRNTVLIMTSNVGSREAVRGAQRVGFGTPSKAAAVTDHATASYRQALERTFAPEFLNRIDEVVQFRALQAEDMEQLTALELRLLAERLQAQGYTLRVTDTARRRLAQLGFEERYGARALKRTLCERVEEPMAQLILDGAVQHGDTVIVACDRSEGVRLRVA